MTIDLGTQKNIDIWLSGNVDEASKKEIRIKLEKNPKEIIDAFYTRLAFGTGGLRGVMGVGTNRMNRYTVQMATQGLANYLLKQPAPSGGHSVFIGFDSRHHSRDFAEEAAKVLAANGIIVYLCKELRPTPLVSFGCRYRHCSSAIMVTASHNPPEYNGYKVYWNDGAQVVPPHDKGIIEQVQAIENFSQVKVLDILDPRWIKEIGEEEDRAYLETLQKYPLYSEDNRKIGHQLKVVYTSLHGTGITLIPKALKNWGFSNIVFVEKQIVPDGDFPTVHYPNPEEKEALKLGLKTMDEVRGDLLIATDPDCDRVGIAVRHQGENVLLNGNQVACLCLYHICEALKDRMPPKAAFIKTIATTELFRTIAESYGAACFDVLTGFKYIAEKIREWEGEKDGFQFIFGGEESYGYLLGTDVRDKDAVISTLLICEAALHAKKNGKSLVDLMNEIYAKFGVYYEKLDSINFPETKDGRERMTKGMEKIQQEPPKKIGDVSVVALENYQTSERIEITTGKKTALKLPKTNAYMFWLEDGTKLLIRPSGTEPKIKIYCGVVDKEPEDVKQSFAKCEKKAAKVLDNFVMLLNI